MSLLHVVDGRGPLSYLEATALDDSEWFLSECHQLSASISGAKQLFMILGLFLMENVSLVDAPDVERLVKAVANLYVSSATGVDAIVTERNAANKSDEALPPVVPRQLTALSHYYFFSVFRNHRERLFVRGGEPHVLM